MGPRKMRARCVSVDLGRDGAAEDASEMRFCGSWARRGRGRCERDAFMLLLGAMGPRQQFTYVFESMENDNYIELFCPGFPRGAASGWKIRF